jgi:hypothetical protein
VKIKISNEKPVEDCFWAKKDMCGGSMGLINKCTNRQGNQNYVHYHCDFYTSLEEGERMTKGLKEFIIPDIRKKNIDGKEVHRYVYFCYSCRNRMSVIEYDYNDEEFCERLVEEFSFFQKQSNEEYNRRQYGWSPYYNYCRKCGAFQGYGYVMNYVTRYPYSYLMKIEEIAEKKKRDLQEVINKEYWLEQRRKKLKMEKYTCEVCSKRNFEVGVRNMHVHHIKPRKKFKLEEFKLAHSLKNLRVVCRKCHVEEERESKRLIT